MFFKKIKNDLNEKLEIEGLSPGNFLLLNQVEVNIFVDGTVVEHWLSSFDAASRVHGRNAFRRRTARVVGVTRLIVPGFAVDVVDAQTAH